MCACYLSSSECLSNSRAKDRCIAVGSFGDARFYAWTGAMALNRPIVGMAATPDGRGYRLVAADGASSASVIPGSLARWVARHSTNRWLG